jgi:electron transfer flavoprotein alpha subunit
VRKKKNDDPHDFLNWKNAGIIPHQMLSARSLVYRRALTRSYATTAPPHALVLLEHRQGVIEPSSLSALTAAEQLGGPVTGLVLGGPDQVQDVVEKAKKYISIPHLKESANRCAHVPG